LQMLTCNRLEARSWKPGWRCLIF